MSGFQGFPAGRTSFTPLPDMFFTSLLPAIDDLAELKVTLHLFWKLNRKKGYPRCVSVDELAHDGTLLQSLRAPGKNPTDVLQEALELGAAGFWLDERIFAVADPAAILQALNDRLHAQVEA